MDWESSDDTKACKKDGVDSKNSWDVDWAFGCEVASVFPLVLPLRRLDPWHADANNLVELNDQIE